jgi:hypothetical protein
VQRCSPHGTSPTNNIYAHFRAHQARRPILDEGIHTCLDPWPNLRLVITNPDTCIVSTILLEGTSAYHVWAASRRCANSIAVLNP